jgi:hypothetical protein
MRVPGGAGARLERDLCAADRAGSGAWNNGSTRTGPVNQSGEPFVEAREPFRLISISMSLLPSSIEQICAAS